MGIQGPSDKNFSNIEPQNGSVSGNSSQTNTPSAKMQGSIWDEVLGSRARIMDSNRDGTVSTEEVQNFVYNNCTNEQIRESSTFKAVINVLAKFVNIKDTQDTMSSAVRIHNKLKTFIKADTDKDNNISNSEIADIESSQTLTQTEKDDLKSWLGVADGKIRNEQGSYGTCWLLSPIKSLSDKDLLGYIEDIDESNNVTIHFYGMENDDGEHYSYTFSREELMLRNSGSTDPDAVAFEAAQENLNKTLEERQLDIHNIILEYIENSEPQQPEKPPVELLSEDMSQEDWEKFYNYYMNSDSEHKPALIHQNLNIGEKYKEYDKSKMIEAMRKYIEDPATHEIPIEKPSKYDRIGNPVMYRFSSSDIMNYIKNSTSDTMQKPEPIEHKATVDLNQGGEFGYACKMLLGEACTSNYVENDGTDETNLKIEDILSKVGENTTLLGADFKENDKFVITNHAYTIVDADSKFVYLSNPWNSEATIKYPKKLFMENYGAVTEVTVDIEKLKELKEQN